MQDDDVDALAAAAGLDGGGAGVAGGGADDGDVLVLGLKHGVEELTEHLHGHVLEGQGRAVELFHHPEIGTELHQRHDGFVPEALVSLGGQLRQAVLDQRAGHEGPHDAHGQLRIIQPLQVLQRFGRDLGPFFRDVEATVARQAGQERFVEADDGGGPAC